MSTDLSELAALFKKTNEPTVVKISFTGHRDNIVHPAYFSGINNSFPGATWIHGGAVGFDSEVERQAKILGVKTIVHLPDYKKFGRGAPLVRNKAIVDAGDFLIACYDGRESGGTFQTIEYAKKTGKMVRILRGLKCIR